MKNFWTIIVVVYVGEGNLIVRLIMVTFKIINLTVKHNPR